MVLESKSLPIQVDKIDFDYVKRNFEEHFPDNVQLVYVECDDSLNHSMEKVCEAIKSNDFLSLANYILDCYSEHQAYNENRCWDKFKSSVLNELEFIQGILNKLDDIRENGDCDGADIENIDEIRDYLESDDCYESFREWLWDHDESGDIARKIIDNTDEPGMFYDLDEWFNESWCWNDKEFDEQIKRVCDILHLNESDEKVRDRVHELLANATGGGYLRVYFNAPVWDLVSGDKNGCKYGTDGSDFKSIKFDGEFMVAIINPYEGSGMIDDDMRLNVSFQFNRSNLRMSSFESYSYEQIFGAYSDYRCDSPEFMLEELKIDDN